MVPKLPSLISGVLNCVVTLICMVFKGNPAYSSLLRIWVNTYKPLNCIKSTISSSTLLVASNSHMVPDTTWVDNCLVVNLWFTPFNLLCWQLILMGEWHMLPDSLYIVLKHILSQFSPESKSCLRCFATLSGCHIQSFDHHNTTRNTIFNQACSLQLLQFY